MVTSNGRVSVVYKADLEWFTSLFKFPLGLVSPPDFLVAIVSQMTIVSKMVINKISPFGSSVVLGCQSKEYKFRIRCYLGPSLTLVLGNQ